MYIVCVLFHMCFKALFLHSEDDYDERGLYKSPAWYLYVLPESTILCTIYVVILTTVHPFSPPLLVAERAGEQAGRQADRQVGWMAGWLAG